MWAEHSTGVPVAQSAQQTLDQLRAHPDSATPPGNPGVQNMFGTGVYERGALALQALRDTVGDEVFFTTLRTYASKFAGSNATTAEFIAVAEQTSGHADLQPLFDAWLFQPDLPQLPS